MDNEDRERPSKHGAILGAGMVALAEAGRKHSPELPPMCATCAFDPNSMTNKMAGTLITAMNCVLGIDTDRFACHHGMDDGQPTKLCAGYIAAVLAPWDYTMEVMTIISNELNSMDGQDYYCRSAERYLGEIESFNPETGFKLVGLEDPILIEDYYYDHGVHAWTTLPFNVEELMQAFGFPVPTDNP